MKKLLKVSKVSLVSLVLGSYFLFTILYAIVKRNLKVSLVLGSLYFLFIILYILVKDYSFLASNFITDFKIFWKLLIIVVIILLLFVIAKFVGEGKQWVELLVQRLILATQDLTRHQKWPPAGELLVQRLILATQDLTRHQKWPTASELLAQRLILVFAALIILVVICLLRSYLGKILLPDGWGTFEILFLFTIVPLIITLPKVIDYLNESLTLELTINLSGIILALATLLLIIHQIIEESTARNWKIVHTEATHNIGKAKALEYLVGKEQSLERIDLSCGTMSRMRRIDYNVHSFTTNTEPYTYCNKPEHKTYLKGLDLSPGDIGNRKANLKGANLKQTNLAEADLSGADLTGANLAGTNLAGADLTNTTLTGVDLIGANLKQTNLTGADLTGADLTGADLTGADLTGADLTGADLTGADLTGADLTNTILAAVNFYDVKNGPDESFEMPEKYKTYLWSRKKIDDKKLSDIKYLCPDTFKPSRYIDFSEPINVSDVQKIIEDKCTLYSSILNLKNSNSSQSKGTNEP